ncbi:MAG TPA: histidine kinase [Pseudonocardiaceae bacterium]|nr:histidine kinase [Pseudonocardiaceae bacterium]
MTLDGGSRGRHAPGTTSLTWATTLAYWIVGTVVVCLAVVALLTVLTAHPGAGGVAQAVGCLVALVLLQLLYFGPRPDRSRTPLAYGLVAVQACLVYLPMLEFKQAWVGMPGFLAGTTLLMFRAPVAPVLFLAVVASMGVAQAIYTNAVYDIVYTTVSTVITGLVVYGLTRLAEVVGELHTSRSKLAALAVTEERLRFARDLHDLLGHSISAINLKAQLAHQLVQENSDATEQQLVELLRISRQALTDVRSVARGYRELSLEAETRSAESILLAADIEANVRLEYQNLPVHVRTLLAIVLRESVTNVLRHSKAKHCDILVRQDDAAVTVEVINDGARRSPMMLPGEQPDIDVNSGSGLDNLSARVTAIGGRLTAETTDDDRFRLLVHIPLPAVKDQSAV